MKTMTNMHSWGRLSAQPHRVIPLRQRALMASTIMGNSLPGIAYGMGRSYGDVCTNPHGTLWTTTDLDHFLSFDATNGLLECEAGVLLAEINRVFVPRGWMLAVTPGTQWVSVGGAIANDVHGKNHSWQGSFGNHVTALTLIRTTGEVIQCSPAEQTPWFYATLGGMGLTGVIAQAQLQLKRVASGWLEAETERFGTIDEFFALSDNSREHWEHTVAWFDCLSPQGRGVFTRARTLSCDWQAPLPSKTFTFPCALPWPWMNRYSLRLFNSAYFHLSAASAARQKGKKNHYYTPFLYPLDGINGWNKAYGWRGFYQYQCVVPHICRAVAIHEMLGIVRQSGRGSFLAVLKSFGEKTSGGMLSFPQHGATLALDFPNTGADILQCFNQLDAIVKNAQGRIYPAKDARMPRSLFEAGYPRVNEFLPYRDPGISSSMSRRLMGA